MGIKLLALDLDGTLLDAASQLSEENREAVVRARQAGVDAVLVTGRSWRGAKPFYDALGMTGGAICYLGGLVVGDATGRVSHYEPLAAEAWVQLRDFALREGLAVTACLGTDQAVADGQLPSADLVAADTAFATCPAADFTNWADWNTYTEMAPDLAPCRVPPVVMAVYGERAVSRVLAQFPNGLPQSQFDLTDRVVGEKVLHIWHARVNKGTALAEFCRGRGIAPSDVMAIGDALMDLSMVTYAGVGVAVPQAHPLLKAGATWVATPAAAIDRILEGVG